MREVQIYIEDQRLDLFKDESIEIKSSIQDAKDISKVFTDYSQSFSIPASAENNKVFKHFYNFNIDGGFDGRVRHEAKIYINTILFKRGKIFLNGVTMKNNVPHTYNITFFGNTVSLTDIFGDDKLIALNDYTDQTKGLLNFDHEFSYSNIKTIFEGEGMQVFSDDSALIYPLITSKKRLFYNSSIGNLDTKNFSGNLFIPSSGYDVDQYHKRGVKPEDLKPAIKAYHIIKAIEEKYNLNLIPDDSAGTKDFFSKHNEAFSNLYLWVSNSSGNITGELGDDEYIYKAKVESWSFVASETNTNYLSADGDEIIVGKYPLAITQLNGVIKTKFFIEVRPDSSYSNVNYRIKVTRSDNGTSQTFEGSGDTDFSISVPFVTSGTYDFRYTVEIYSETPMVDTEIKFMAREGGGGLETGYDRARYTSGANITSDTAEVGISNHLPDIKVIDFLTGLFKMFNLTAYYIDDENDPEYSSVTPVVKITTLDDYYGDAVNNQSNGMIDISEYVDISNHQVNTSLPFSEIDFKFEETDSIINENHKQLAGIDFGDSNLSIKTIYPNFFHGEKYEVKLPFSKLKYERILNTDIQWGYAAGGAFNAEDFDYSDQNDIVPPKGDYGSTNIKPLLFYGIRKTSITNSINFSDDSSATSSVVSNYYRPSNTNEDAVDNETPSDFSINFDSEIDEWSGQENLNSLFEVFYKSYIRSVFDKDKRIFKFQAYLPPSFLIHYKLNDQLKVQDVVYRINSITTNLSSGKTELELINLNSEEIV